MASTTVLFRCHRHVDDGEARFVPCESRDVNKPSSPPAHVILDLNQDPIGYRDHRNGLKDEGGLASDPKVRARALVARECV